MNVGNSDSLWLMQFTRMRFSSPTCTTSHSHLLSSTGHVDANGMVDMIDRSATRRDMDCICVAYITVKLGCPLNILLLAKLGCPLNILLPFKYSPPFCLVNSGHLDVHMYVHIHVHIWTDIYSPSTNKKNPNAQKDLFFLDGSEWVIYYAQYRNTGRTKSRMGKP